MNIAFTGHRPQKLGGFDDSTNLCVPVVNAIHKEMCKLSLRDVTIISGMAMGVDQWVAQYAVTRGIPFHAYVPFKGQEVKWFKETQQKYFTLLKAAQKIIYVCDPGYAAWKMQKRNEAMVDNCDILIAIWDGTSGGTDNCVRYAQSKNKHIIRIDPSTLHT